MYVCNMHRDTDFKFERRICLKLWDKHIYRRLEFESTITSKTGTHKLQSSSTANAAMMMMTTTTNMKPSTPKKNAAASAVAYLAGTAVLLTIAVVFAIQALRQCVDGIIC